MPEPSNSTNGAMLSPTPPMVETATGRFVDLLNPDPGTLNEWDVAAGLSRTCRYGGHVRRFYSVAEHAVLVHDLMRWQAAPEEARRGALFHDAAEAYLGDLVAPLKWALRAEEITHDAYSPVFKPEERRSAYDHLTDKMEIAVSAAFGVTVASMNSAALRLADMWALCIEAKALTVSRGANWRWPGELPLDGALPDTVDWLGGRDPADAARLWLRRVGEAPASSSSSTESEGHDA